VGTETDGERIRLIIQDTGCGFRRKFKPVSLSRFSAPKKANIPAWVFLSPGSFCAVAERTLTFLPGKGKRFLPFTYRLPLAGGIERPGEWLGPFSPEARSRLLLYSGRRRRPAGFASAPQGFCLEQSGGIRRIRWRIFYWAGWSDASEGTGQCWWPGWWKVPNWRGIGDC